MAVIHQDGGFSSGLNNNPHSLHCWITGDTLISEQRVIYTPKEAEP